MDKGALQLLTARGLRTTATQKQVAGLWCFSSNSVPHHYTDAWKMKLTHQTLFSFSQCGQQVKWNWQRAVPPTWCAQVWDIHRLELPLEEKYPAARVISATAPPLQVLASCSSWHRWSLWSCSPNWWKRQHHGSVFTSYLFIYAWLHSAHTPFLSPYALSQWVSRKV